MKRNVMKVLSITLLAMIMIMAVATPVMALTPDQITGNTDVAGTTEIQTLGQGLVGILQTAGIVLSVVIIIVLGVKYMMGSPEDKSQYKSSMLPYIIGAALIFAASLLANIIYQFFFNLGK